MKNSKYILILAMILITGSCSKDYLNTEPGNAISDAAVWKSEAYAEQFLYGIYFNMPFPRQWLELGSLVDEQSFIQVDGISTRVTESNMTADDKGGMGSANWADGQQAWNWPNVYKRVRETNLLMEKLDEVPFADEAKKTQMKGEAHWLRAFNYFTLMKQYGGVPLIDKTYEFAESGVDYSVPRNTLEETVNFIVADLDQAADMLPAEGPRTRATKGAALALKSRVLLYAASDLFNSSDWTGGYGHPELISYTGGDRNARWQAAKDAAKAVIDMGIYGLYKAEPGSGDNLVNNITNMIYERSSEDIFLQYYDAVHYWYWQTDWAPSINSSQGYNGFGLNRPLGNLADSYEMADGTKFDWNNPAHKANPYANRDPRLQATMLVEGQEWFGRKVQSGHWSDGTPGLDYGSLEGTGYWMRKFIDPNFNHVYYGTPKANTAFFTLRYAEILLNYAEASLELGQEDEARTYINMIRKRAGMPPVSDAGAALVERLRNERKVELAFEEHRFWDVRRWLIGDEAYEPATGVDIVYPVAGSTDNPTFSVKVTEPNRKWENKSYLMAISTNDLNTNSLLIQNPGY